MRSVSCTNSIVFSQNDFPLSRSGKELRELWKICGHDEATIFSNYFWASITSSKLLSNNDFSSIGGSEKEYMNQNRGVNIVKIMNKMVENWTQGRWIPMNHVKSGNYFENYSHRIGDMGHIELDNPNSAYLVRPCCT